MGQQWPENLEIEKKVTPHSIVSLQKYVNNRNEAGIKIRFQVAHLLAKEGKPLTNDELIKLCLQQLKKCVHSSENKLA